MEFETEDLTAPIGTYPRKMTRLKTEGGSAWGVSFSTLWAAEGRGRLLLEADGACLCPDGGFPMGFPAWMCLLGEIEALSRLWDGHPCHIGGWGEPDGGFLIELRRDGNHVIVQNSTVAIRVAIGDLRRTFAELGEIVSHRLAPAARD